MTSQFEVGSTATLGKQLRNVGWNWIYSRSGLVFLPHILTWPVCVLCNRHLWFLCKHRARHLKMFPARKGVSLPLTVLCSASSFAPSFFLMFAWRLTIPLFIEVEALYSRQSRWWRRGREEGTWHGTMPLFAASMQIIHPTDDYRAGQKRGS